MNRRKLLNRRYFCVPFDHVCELQALGFRALGFYNLKAEGAHKAHGPIRIGGKASAGGYAPPAQGSGCVYAIQSRPMGAGIWPVARTLAAISGLPSAWNKGSRHLIQVRSRGAPAPQEPMLLSRSQAATGGRTRRVVPTTAHQLAYSGSTPCRI